ncbi:hypothetical protein KCU89_g18914, partial [Aureobasidium melanogenum]
PPPAAPKEAATPVVPASAKRLNADPEIMTSRLRPRAGRADAIASAPNTAYKKKREQQKRMINTKRTAAGIPTWSPTVVLICRSTAYVWQSGRDAQFSADCG